MSDLSHFDTERGSLRLTPAGVEAVTELAGERGGVDDDVLEELQDGGVVVDGALHPRLDRVGRCLARPNVRLTADHALPARWTTEAWVDDEIAVMLRWSFGGPRAADVAAIPRGMLALNLARGFALAPRPRVKVDRPVELDAGFLEALLGSGETWATSEIERMLSGDEVLPEWVDILASVSAKPERRWRVGAWWNSVQESPAARQLEVLEAGMGSFLVTHHRDPERAYRRVRLHPLTATQIWRLLCGLVPPDEQIERPLVD